MRHLSLGVIFAALLLSSCDAGRSKVKQAGVERSISTEESRTTTTATSDLQNMDVPVGLHNDQIREDDPLVAKDLDGRENFDSTEIQAEEATEEDLREIDRAEVQATGAAVSVGTASAEQSKRLQTPADQDSVSTRDAASTQYQAQEYPTEADVIQEEQYPSDDELFADEYGDELQEEEAMQKEEEYLRSNERKTYNELQISDDVDDYPLDLEY